ncbi:MAG: pyridoxamine 5'-phosphate oxidase family protein [Gemmatimonadaceae bacterium]|nr:pyridoxamine 5'-phosphate oxidase family protein [Gemmatimonadaceae bacterium]
MRRFLSGLCAAVIAPALLALPTRVAAQRGRPAPDSATRAAVDSFVVTMRDMAAWAVQTPAAHIPVGGLLDAAGNVSSVVGSGKEEPYTREPALVEFRTLLGAAGRTQRSPAIGLGYRIRRTTPSGPQADAIMVEFEHRSGYRANVIFPFTRTEAGDVVFETEQFMAGTLRELAPKRDVAAVTRTRPLVVPPAAAEGDFQVITSGTTRLEQVARLIVRAAPYPTFITTDATGRPQARTVQPLAPDSTWTVWFATNPRTRKVTEIQRDPRVVLHYFDQATLSYVSLIGRARVVRDRATKAAHWTPAWDAFYPDRDASVVLIAVQAEQLEVVSSTLGVSGDSATWRPPTLRVQPTRPVRARPR